MKFKVSTGNIEIVKGSEDNRVDGVTFHIRNENHSFDVTTGIDGIATAANIPVGDYVITEEVPLPYVAQESQ